jgi:hypothetical protein
VARDGSGNYSLPEAAFVNGSTIDATAVNSDFSDIASALTQSMSKDGQTTPTANQPMNNYKHTGVGAASARTDYARADQVIGSVLDYAIDTGSADAYAIAPSPGISAYVVGQTFRLKVINANATTTPTLAVNGLTAGLIKWPDGTALQAGDLPANSFIQVEVSATTPVFHLQTVARPPATLAGTNTFTGTNDFTGGRSKVPTRTAGDAGTDSASTAFVLGSTARNRLINGDLSIDQRNEGSSQTFTAAAAVAYTVDRWYASCTGANITGQRVTGTSPNRYAYKFTGAASNTAVLFGQRIEAANIGDLVSADVVGSLQVKSSSITTLTWTAYYANSADDFSAKTQIATGTLTITSTLTRYSFTFNAGANAGTGIAIEFSCGALLATQTLQFEAIQLQAGTTAGAFQAPSVSANLADCQRYYQKSYNPGVALATSTAVGLVGSDNGNGVVNSINIVQLAPTMRGNPTISYWDKAGNASKYSTGDNNSFTDNVGTLTIQNASTRAFQSYQAASGTAYFHYSASAEL